MRAFFLTCILFLALQPLALAGGYVGNAYGVEGKYQIFEFTDEGNPWRPVSGGAEAAWPSAIQTGSTVQVFAVERVSGSWSTIHRWTSTNGAAYVDGGTVFTADSSEPYGIGPATITYDGTTYRLYYLIRGSSGPGTTVGLATSTNGTSFTRRGIIYTAGSEAAGGLSVSYACTDGDTSYLFLHAYSSGLSPAGSIVAWDDSPDGPYTYGANTIGSSGISGTISGIAGNAFGAFTGLMTVGRPIIVNDVRAEPYLPIEIVGSTVYFDRPFELTYSSDPWADFLANKADLSFVQKVDEDHWIGAATGYGQFTSVTSEYTSPLVAEDVVGPWTVGPGYFLSPYFNSGERSSENPEPIRTNSSCAAE